MIIWFLVVIVKIDLVLICDWVYWASIGRTREVSFFDVYDGMKYIKCIDIGSVDKRFGFIKNSTLYNYLKQPRDRSS